MEWSFEKAQIGDAVRVKLGEIYHYGILVDNDQIIQFGLPPTARQEVKNQEVSVCLSNVEIFLQGGRLERGKPQLEDGEKRSAQQVVEYAKSQLGRKGYHILHNNCEHFVYECIFGQKKSLQTDNVRAFFASLPIADVYTFAIPENFEYTTLYPQERDEEVSAVANPKVRAEKYFAWKLLEYALMRTFGFKIKDLKFTKSPEGKWLCDKCYFSISHSHSLVAVALSKKPIGIDCELIKKPKTDAIERVLTSAERDSLTYCNDEEKTEQLLTVWSKKESLFKCNGTGKFYPANVETTKGSFAKKTIVAFDKEYVLTTCSEYYKTVRYFEKANIE